MFGPDLRKVALEIFCDSFEAHNISPDELVSFTEKITDECLSKELSYKILDALALHDDEALLGIVLKEYRRRCMVFSIHLKEYPELFYRRIYIPIRYTALEFLTAIISVLRTIDYEDTYLMVDGKKYQFDGENKLEDLSIFDLKNVTTLSVIYGYDRWCFLVTPLGLTYYNDNELTMPYLVEDGVGYGIEGMSKNRLFDMLDESIECSTETNNPIMDDEDFEFYNADIDNLNENAKEDFNYTLKRYKGKNEK